MRRRIPKPRKHLAMDPTGVLMALVLLASGISGILWLTQHKYYAMQMITFGRIDYLSGPLHGPPPTLQFPLWYGISVPGGGRAGPRDSSLEVP